MEHGFEAEQPGSNVHESWNFPAGVSFALKQNTVCIGVGSVPFCLIYQALGGGPFPERISKFEGGGGWWCRFPPGPGLG